MQRQRSDAALNAWDVKHPHESSDELTAFRELQRLGVYTDKNYFSPSLAKNAFYRETLKQHTATPGSTNGAGTPRRKGDSGAKGTGLDAPDAKQGFRPRRSRRRTRS